MWFETSDLNYIEKIKRGSENRISCHCVTIQEKVVEMVLEQD